MAPDKTRLVEGVIRVSNSITQGWKRRRSLVENMVQLLSD